MVVRYAYTTGKAGDLGSLPGYREKYGRVSQDAEIVCVVGVLPDVLAGEDQIFPGRLLQSGVEFISPAGSQRCWPCRSTPEKGIQHWAVASDPGDDQGLGERCFE